ncbi:MAG: hypothetical protein U5J63_04000 [Fodinibius sp.]|nr:hypothetical protein [Fodinibius sp.]
MRSENLAADLKTLGVGAVDDITVPPTLTDSQPAEIGCLYVLEGSRLGVKSLPGNWPAVWADCSQRYAIFRRVD